MQNRFFFRINAHDDNGVGQSTIPTVAEFNTSGTIILVAPGLVDAFADISCRVFNSGCDVQR